MVLSNRVLTNLSSGVPLVFFKRLFKSCEQIFSEEESFNPKEEINIEEMSYKIHIQPLFNANCVNCHGNNGNLSLTSYNNLMKGGNSGKSSIANNSTGSLLINRLSGVGPGQRMPPEPASQLDDTKIE